MMKKKEIERYRAAVDRLVPHDGFTDETLARLRAEGEHTKRTPRKRILAVAAAALLVAAGGAIGVVAIEAKEYRAAVEFFDEYALPTAELTRSEIKAVYRDITTGSFSLDKTSELLLREIKSELEGKKIEAEAAWNARNAALDLVKKSEYRFETVEYINEERGFLMGDHTLARRYAGEHMLWEIKLDDFLVEDYTTVEGGILVYGYNFTWSSTQKRFARIALLDEDGTLRWDKRIDRGYKSNMPCTALADGDRLIIFGRGDFVELTVTVFDYAGNELLHTAHEVGNYGIRQAVKLGDGYLLRLSNYKNGDKLVKLDSTGELLDVLAYTADDICYVITDMIEHGEKLYLSTYAFPAPADGDVQGRNEIAPILAELFGDGSDGVLKINTPSEEIAAMLKAQYTAVLFLCDPESGEPEQFYSVEGALGGALAINADGQLCWDTEHFTEAIFSPATSAFTIAADCRILRCTFSADGILLGETATNETIGYWR